MEINTYYTQISETPRVYDVTLKYGDTIEFKQRVIWGLSEGDFGELIDAIENGKGYTCTYGLYGTNTVFNVTNDMIIIVRHGPAGDTVYKFPFKDNRETFINFAKNLQTCMMECRESVEGVPEEVMAVIKGEFQTRMTMSQFTDSITRMVSTIYAKK